MNSLKKVLPSKWPLPLGIAQVILISGLGFWVLVALYPLLQANRSSTPPAISLPSVNITTGEVDLMDRFPELSLRFEENQGQTDPRVRFLSRGATNTAFFMSNEVIFTFAEPDDPQSRALDGVIEDAAVASGADDQVSVIRMKLKGANPDPRSEGVERLPGTISYYLASNATGNLQSIPTFAGIRYFDVYPGIDVVFYGRQGNLEYDFVVSPGADPNNIRLAFAEVDRLEIDSRGHLFANGTAGRLHQTAPRIYQEINGKKQRIDGAFSLPTANEVGLKIGGYDSNLPLIIDPVLEYTSYFGANGRDYGYGVAIDNQGNAYVAVESASLSFPLDADGNTTNVARQTEAYVIKISPDASQLLYVAYLGGKGFDSAQGIGVDNQGQIVLTGTTTSLDFPLVNPIQPAYAGGAYDAFVTKLSADGGSLLYSTYLGGSQDDGARALALGATGDVYIAGETASTDLPGTGSLQSTAAGDYDCFVAGISGSAQPELKLSYLGGTGFDSCRAITVNSSGIAYLTGTTGSDDFPLIDAIQPNYRTGGRDAFVLALNLDDWSVDYSTYLGGSGDDDARGIAVDPQGAAYITGKTASTDFPMSNAAQPRYQGGDYDVFVAKVAPSGDAVVFATYIGGAKHEIGNGIAVDDTGAVYVVGATASTNFPTRIPIQSGYGGGPYDLFVTKLGPSGNLVWFSTFLGGSRNDRGMAVTLDAASNLFVVGHTLSNDFPRAGSTGVQAAPFGNSDTVIAKLSP